MLSYGEFCDMRDVSGEMSGGKCLGENVWGKMSGRGNIGGGGVRVECRDHENQFSFIRKT